MEAVAVAGCTERLADSFLAWAICALTSPPRRSTAAMTEEEIPSSCSLMISYALGL